MTDEIQQLNDNINDLEYHLLAWISPNPNGPHKKVRTGEYSTADVVQQVNNYRNNPSNSISDAEEKQMNDWTNELNGYQSQLDTDRRDNKKNITHIAHKTLPKVQQVLSEFNLPKRDQKSYAKYAKVQQYVNDLNSKFSKHPQQFNGHINLPLLLKYTHGAANQSTYNYNSNKRDADTYESPQNSWTMIGNLLKYLTYKHECNQFLNQYTKNKPGYLPYKYNGKMFYFPNKMGTPGNDSKFGYIEGLINRNYYANLNKQNAYNRITNNEYHKLHQALYNSDLRNASNDLSTHELNILNNHPTDDLPAGQHMAKAISNFQYKIQKYRTWQQYYQDKINYMNRFDSNLANDYTGKLTKAVKGGLSFKARPGTTYSWLSQKYGIPVQEIRDANPGIADRRIPIGYRIKLPSRRMAKYLKNGDKLINKYSPQGRRYEELLKLRNKWKSRADKLNDQLPSKREKTLDLAYLNSTVDNLHTDSRNGNFAYIRPVDPETDESYVFMQVTDEAPTHSTEAASVPVEWGRNITTNTQKQPITVSISGNLFNNELPKSAQDGQASQEPNDGHGLDPVKTDASAIANWSDHGKPMYYCGTNLFPICIITDFEPDYNTGPDGSLTSCSFTMTLQVADYFHSNVGGNSGISGLRHGKSHDHGNIGRKRGRRSSRRNRKHFIIAKSGMTYYKLALRKHVSVKSVSDMNKYSATDIPIGSKIYY